LICLHFGGHPFSSELALGSILDMGEGNSEAGRRPYLAHRFVFYREIGAIFDDRIIDARFKHTAMHTKVKYRERLI
jgi:hypothetical protein